MNIVVCVKQVPDTTEVKIDPKTNTLIREGVDSILNPFDAYALETGLQLKEKLDGKVIVITMGPPQAESVLREAIGMGADEVILLSDRAFAGADTLATSYTLAQAIRKIDDVGLVICGKQAIDGDTAQVGPGIAAHLDIPQLAFVKAIREFRNNELIVDRLLEDGTLVMAVSLPAVLTVEKDIYPPRMPSLRGKMLAKKAEIPVWTSKDIDVEPERLGLDGSPTWVDKIASPPPRTGGGALFEGDPQEVVDQFTARLKEDNLLS
jgi:electron transfer flavoprotein beta subunit